MSNSEVFEQIPGTPDAGGPYTVYSAGGLFTQDELATNVLIKEAVWRLSNGKYQLFLPQSREIQSLDRSDVETYIRNTDLEEVLKADILLARFDGPDLDSGTVVEFTIAKFLGKATVILRSDFRRMSFGDLCEPYNLMVKNWPRTVEIQINSYAVWADRFAEELNGVSGSDALQDLMKAELGSLQQSTDDVARQVIAGLDAVREMESPYPPEIQELAYRTFRLCPGGGFDELLTADELDKLIQRFRKNGTL